MTMVMLKEVILVIVIVIVVDSDSDRGDVAGDDDGG